MNRRHIPLLVLIAFTFSHQGAYALKSIDLFIGVPKGSMDASIDGRLSWQFYSRGAIRLSGVFEQNNSYNYDAEAKGNIFLFTSSLFLLTNIEKPVTGDKIAAFVSAGPGIHLLNSYATSSSAIGKQRNTSSSIKAHLFFGLKYLRWRDSYFFLLTRGTIPGEYIFDSIYLGYGRCF